MLQRTASVQEATEERDRVKQQLVRFSVPRTRRPSIERFCCAPSVYVAPRRKRLMSNPLTQPCFLFGFAGAAACSAAGGGGQVADGVAGAVRAGAARRRDDTEPLPSGPLEGNDPKNNSAFHERK